MKTSIALGATLVLAAVNNTTAHTVNRDIQVHCKLGQCTVSKDKNGQEFVLTELEQMRVDACVKTAKKQSYYTGCDVYAQEKHHIVLAPDLAGYFNFKP